MNPISNSLLDLSLPDVFAEGMLNMKLYPKQRDVLRALAPRGSAVSFRSCNEGGKTKVVIVAAILWHLTTYPKGQVITTSGSYRQIKDQLVPALHAHQSRFPTFKFLRTPRIETPNPQCFWEGFSTDEAGKFEGHHAGGPDEPLLIIVDEAKTVKDDIFEAVERCKPTRLLIASSTWYAEGEFYRSQTTRAKFYTKIIQTAAECPHWTQAQIDQLHAKWGPSNPLVKSMVMAEFMESVADAIVPLKSLEDILVSPPVARRAGRDPFQYKAFCDFAWGNGRHGDETVVALRDGNVVTIVEAFRSGDLNETAVRLIHTFRRHSLQPWQIDGDEGGGGKQICDYLKYMGWPINRVNNGAAPKYCQHYANLAAEMWYEGAQKIIRREIILPDDNELRAQILDRKSVPNAQGKLAIESKSDMKKRGVHSPDRADAVFGAMTPVRRIQSYNLIDHTYANGNANANYGTGPWDGFEKEWKVFGENEEEFDHGYPPGCWPGC